MIDPISDWKGRVRGLLLEQFKDKPNFLALADAWAAQVQQLEDSAQALLTLSSIDDSEGAQLQVIGRLVGQPYTGESDPLYRLRLKARVRVNKSSGTPEELYGVFVALYAGVGSATIVEYEPATMVFRVNAPALDWPSVLVLLALLRAAKEGGVRLLLEWVPTTDSPVFVFAAGAGDGFPDPGDPTVGGKFAGAIQA